MIIPDEIKIFLSGAEELSLGYNEIKFVHPDNLDHEQIGYSVDANGNSLIAGAEGDWREEWLVIASDQLGDPIIVDVSSPNLTVLSAMHGEGDWNPFVIADSLDKFKDIISNLNIISRDRTNPVTLEQNPVTEKEQQHFLKKIEIQNPGVELWYWENFFETD